MADDARRDRDRRCEIGRAVSADEQDARLERFPLLDLEAVDEQPLARVDAVLFTAETDDCVAAHSVETRAVEPANRQCS